MGPAVPAARLHRSWPQRFLITFNCILIAMCVMAASAVGYSYYRFGNIPRVALGDFLADQPAGEPQNYLLVGSDSRAFVQGDGDQSSFGDESDSGGQRADTIILLRIDPQAETANMTSFPRDLWLTIAGTGGAQQRINTAFEGGPAQLIETIEQSFDIPIHHYAQVDFEGFRELVDAIGGVDLYFEHPVRDRDAQSGNNLSGLDIEATGCVTLDGEDALAFVRSRHYQEFVDGRWQSDVTSDIGRITRQQNFVATAVRQALEAGLFNPAKFNGLIGVAERHLTLDDELDPRNILDLADRFKSSDPAALQTHPLPTEVGMAGDASVVFLLEDEARVVLDIFRGIEPVQGETAAVPSQVTVSVLNGSGMAGQAAGTAEGLTAAGFNVADTGNASPQFERTTIRYGPDERTRAELLASYLPEPPVLVTDSSVSSVDVVLVTGLDHTGVLSTPRSAEATPAPTAPPEEASEPIEPTC